MSPDKSGSLFKTLANVYDGAFSVEIINPVLFSKKKSILDVVTEFWQDLWKYSNLQDEAKMQQIILIVTTVSVSRLLLT